MTRRLGISVALLLVGWTPGSGQSVSSVVNEMYSVYARSTENVHDYRIVQRSMGSSSVSYFERETVDGMRLFPLKEGFSGGYNFRLDGRPVGYGDVLLFGPLLIERGSYAGMADLDGRSAHVLTVDDLSGLELVGPAGADEIEFVPSRARIYVDSELWIPIGFDFDGTADPDDGTRQVTITLRMSDVRDVDGLLIPYHARIELEGLDAVIDPQAREQLEKLRAQLESMPPVQRQLMEEMMADEMESLRRMMGGEGQPNIIDIDITSVAVNQGPPGL